MDKVKKTGSLHFMKNKALLILIADKLTICLLIVFLLKQIGTPGWDMIIIFSFFALIQIFIVLFQIREQVKPLQELERVASIIEDGLYDGDSDYLEGLTNDDSYSGVERLIFCVKTALQNNYTSQMLKSQAEVHALQSQINPHFLYNTLETIRSHAIVQKSTEIAEMTEALATLFRYSISQPGEMTSFAEELENVDNYLTIQRYRFPDKFSVVKKIEDEEIFKYRLPILTIQPIIENAIHHGLETKLGVGTITIRAFSTQTRLVIMIEDDGSGISEERLREIDTALHEKPKAGDMAVEISSARKKAGIALINVNRRIQFYFGQEYGIHVYSTQGVGTTVELSLPKM
ncbi:MAG: sensor histidine kinase [Flexilinea sp.]